MESCTCNWGWTCALSCAVTISCVSSRCSPNWLDTWHTHRPASSWLRWRMCSTSCDGVTRSVWVTERSCPSWSLYHLHIIENNQKTRWMDKLVHGGATLVYIAISFVKWLFRGRKYVTWMSKLLHFPLKLFNRSVHTNIASDNLR